MGRRQYKPEQIIHMLRETEIKLANYLDKQGMDHTRGRPYHPQTQGNI